MNQVPCSTCGVPGADAQALQRLELVLTSLLEASMEPPLVAHGAAAAAPGPAAAAAAAPGPKGGGPPAAVCSDASSSFHAARVAGGGSSFPEVVLLSVVVPEYVTCYGQQLAVVGSCEALGVWDAHKSTVMQWREGHRWEVDIQLLRAACSKLEFKASSGGHGASRVDGCSGGSIRRPGASCVDGCRSGSIRGHGASRVDSCSGDSSRGLGGMARAVVAAVVGVGGMGQLWWRP